MDGCKFGDGRHRSGKLVLSLARPTPELQLVDGHDFDSLVDLLGRKVWRRPAPLLFVAVTTSDGSKSDDVRNHPLKEVRKSPPTIVSRVTRAVTFCVFAVFKVRRS